ncbi:AMP-dependent synthetase/ligase [Mycobacterium sp.]|uniref:AMP-dependent synthetase/ligase n=1 Tax=Mycobacterium sp. TaxID=1785 RepID=UPI002B8AE34B|nr:AMP-dependent synthetase/ligase [Mycobacterium sp.]HTY33989.1 AMP-dependent synthetase/ligase [Mycobacterium sp.]
MNETTAGTTATGAASLAALFFDRADASPDKEAFRYLEDGRWVSTTWRDAAAWVEPLAAGLLALGVQPEQRVGIASSTRYEWILADLAVMCAGAATTTVYANTNAADTAYILGDSGSRIVFAENDDQLAKLTAQRAALPDVCKVVVFDGAADGDWVITLNDLAEIGAKYLLEHPRCVRQATEAITPERLATLIYTSGTTGRPKGVLLPHRPWVYWGAAAAQHIVCGDDVQLLWLPLAHAFGKMLIAAQLACGFASAVDGRIDKIMENAAVIRPTFMAAAPRIFEKAHARIVTMMQERGGPRSKLFSRAFAVGLEVDRRRRAGQTVPLLLRLERALFDRLVFAKVRDLFGGRIRFFVSGAAPLNREVAEWFHAAGLLIIEGYGLTETAGGGLLNRPNHYKLGTVGLPFEGTHTRIGDHGEIQMNGPCVMAGYYNMPEATREAFTDDGYLRTGDKGEFDADGFLTITGRIKDLFKTSGGKYIAPTAIEEKLIALCPYASQVLVLGEARNFCIALITVDPEMIASWAAERGRSGASYPELVESTEVHQLIDEYVQRLNAELNRWETIKKWALLDHDLSVEAGELTPSMKVKRDVVAERNKALIDDLYR